MSTQTLFKWRHFQADIILLNVRWYCRYALSYRDLEEMMRSSRHRRGSFHPESMGAEIRPGTGPPDSSSSAIDERLSSESMRRISSVLGVWKYLYRAVDSAGNTLDFMLTCKAGRQCCRALFSPSIEGDAYPIATGDHGG